MVVHSRARYLGSKLVISSNYKRMITALMVPLGSIRQGFVNFTA